MATRAQWDDWFAAWAKPPAESEREKCENAVRAIRSAIDASEALAGRIVRVFPQGSYSNRTNVRAESDVDVCVCSSISVYYDPDVPPAQLGMRPATYLFPQFREDVRAALVAKFGAGVAAGRKAFDVHENTNRIAADVVPTFEYRLYDPNNRPLHVGTAFLCENKRIVNYPQQHYDNGVAKNDATARRFKALARILKRLRYEMAGADKPAAKAVQSYLIECLVWNVPTPLFGAATLREDLVAALAHMWAALENDQKCADWKEVNGIKPLFGAGQPWTREQARAFVLEVWTYAELAS
jgi:hypothetical protein